MGAYDVGEAVEARYKELGLTQETLASVAQVSNSTIRNVLRGRVAEARTWPAIERALGWLPGSLTRLRQGENPEEILPAEAMAAIWLAIFRIRNDMHVTETIFRYNSVANAVAEDHSYGQWGERSKGLMGTLWRYLRSELSPVEAAPLLEALRVRGMPELGNPLGPFVRQPLEPSGELGSPPNVPYGSPSPGDPLTMPLYSSGSIGASPSEDPLGASSHEIEFLEEVASHVGDTHVTLRRLGKDVGVGLVHVKANIPITSTHVYWLTEDDMKVISQAIETQVVQMARSLAHARSQTEDQHRGDQRQMAREFQSFRDRARRDWRRQVALVKKLAEAGQSVHEIAEVLGDTDSNVEKMLTSNTSEVT